MDAKKSKKSKPPPKLDSMVVLTVLTSNPSRRDEIDRVIDCAFGEDPRVQVVRVVGYPSADELAGLSGNLDEVAAAGVVSADSEA